MLTLFFAVAPAAHAAGWFDDFNDGSTTDGNPVTWSEGALGIFPGDYDASSGDYALSRPGSGNNNQIGSWVDNTTFSNLYTRAQGVVLPGPSPGQNEGSLTLIGRFEISFFGCYLLQLDTNGVIALEIMVNGLVTDLTPPISLTQLDATSDVIIELNIVGNLLSGYAWRPGNPKPTTPQITATDDTFGLGKAGLGFFETDDNTLGLFRFAAAQDAPFIDFLTGDYNKDGHVNAADYVVWRKNPATNGGDPDGYIAWRQNYGASALGSSDVLDHSIGVPEPPTMLIQCLTATCLLARRSGRRVAVGRG